MGQRVDPSEGASCIKRTPHIRRVFLAVARAPIFLPVGTMLALVLELRARERALFKRSFLSREIRLPRAVLSVH